MAHFFGPPCTLYTACGSLLQASQHSVVCVSACVCVFTGHTGAPSKRMNRSRCCFRGQIARAQDPCVKLRSCYRRLVSNYVDHLLIVLDEFAHFVETEHDQGNRRHQPSPLVLNLLTLYATIMTSRHIVITTHIVLWHMNITCAYNTINAQAYNNQYCFRLLTTDALFVTTNTAAGVSWYYLNDQRL